MTESIVASQWTPGSANDCVDTIIAAWAQPLGSSIDRDGPFATVRNRREVTKGPRSRATGIAMAFKLIEAAQARWRAVNAPHLVALVRAGAKFENGQLVERPDEQPETTAA